MLLQDIGILKKEITAYNKKHIYTEMDLLRTLPRKYRDYTAFANLSERKDGDYVAVRAVLGKISLKGTGNKFVQLAFIAKDTVTPLWFHVNIFAHKACGYLVNKVYPPYLNRDVVVYGKLTIDPTYGYAITPEKGVGNGTGIEYLDSFINGIYTVYPKIGTVKDESLRRSIKRLIPMQREMLEEEIVSSMPDIPSMPYQTALQKAHFPKTMHEIEEAGKQFVLYDLLHFALEIKELEKEMPTESTIRFSRQEKMNAFIQSLPYALTKSKNDAKDPDTGILSGGQLDAIWHMAEKASSGSRLNALVEGDVGCGKTLVAVCMMILAHENGYQAVLAAPKTVLAEQHYNEIKTYADNLGIVCEYLHAGTSAADKKARKEAIKRIKDGTASFIIGTHSCFSSDVEYKRLGLTIMDEEQQFGAEQKIALYKKSLPGCHTIELSATPIPRSLTMSLYGTKDIIRITEKPAGRLPVMTATRRTMATALAVVEAQLKKGRQAYVVCPAIDDNEDAGFVGVDTIGEKYREYMSERGYKVGIVNGRMKADEFSATIEAFKKNEIQVLVSTTVIEVGVNVPNATIIVVHQAERFGLSQLHQLRGRVGRREYQSYCLLITDDVENERIDAMCTMTDGFAIAEADYRMRGPGNVIGTEQSGESVYIEEAMDYPKLFAAAKTAAEVCTPENMLGFFLQKAYRESEACQNC